MMMYSTAHSLSSSFTASSCLAFFVHASSVWLDQVSFHFSKDPVVKMKAMAFTTCRDGPRGKGIVVLAIVLDCCQNMPEEWHGHSIPVIADELKLLGMVLDRPAPSYHRYNKHASCQLHQGAELVGRPLHSSKIRCCRRSPQ